MKYGYTGQFLEIDLTKNIIKKIPLENKFINKFIGGAGFTVQTLYEEMVPLSDPLGPENILCFSPGILVGTIAPSASVTAVSAKSPLTGLMGTSLSGGFWGSELKYAGYDGIIIKGRAVHPVYVIIENEQVDIISAQHLKGKDSWETIELIRLEHKDKSIQVACTGQGGENLCRFASIQNSLYDSWDSAGLGAVMGSKNLKAIAVRGTGSVHVYNRKEFLNTVNDCRKAVSKSPLSKEIKKKGKLSETILSTSIMQTARNFHTFADPDWAKSQINKMLKDNCSGAVSCFACSTACSHWIELREGPYAGLKLKEYTLLPLLGFNFGCDLNNLPAAARMSEMCKRYGLDAVSAAGTIAFAMELFQRGLVAEKDLGFSIEWGKAETVEHLLKMISNHEGIGAILAEGTKKAGVIIPDADYYAMQVKGLEISGTDPRLSSPTLALGQITSIMGNPEYYLQYPDEKTGQAEKIKSSEDLSTIHHLLGICAKPLFLRAEGPALFARLYNSLTGSEISPQELMLAGERVWNLQKLFNLREGEKYTEAVYPDRFFTEDLNDSPPLDRGQMKKALSEYYACRGWDPREGRPLPEKLKELSLINGII